MIAKRLQRDKRPLQINNPGGKYVGKQQKVARQLRESLKNIHKGSKKGEKSDKNSGN